MALTNEVRIIGYCGEHPVLKKYSEDKKIISLPIYSEHWTRSDANGKVRKFKELHWCIFFGNNADRANKLLMKGSQVHLCGAIHYHKSNHHGRTEIKTQIIVEEFTISSKAIMTKELYEHIFSESSENNNE